MLIPSNTLATKDFTKVTIQTNLVLLEVIFQSCFYAKDPSEKTSYSAWDADMSVDLRNTDWDVSVVVF